MLSFKKFYFLVEGGNVFAGKTDSIKLENIKPTLEAYFKELKSIFPKKAKIFNDKHFHAIGSVGKKPVSGDIDLAVDVSSILDKEMSDESIAEWGIDPVVVHTEFEKLQKRAKTSSPSQLMMKAFLKELTLYINKNAKNLYCDENKVTPGNIFGLYPQIDPDGKKIGSGVQIDWMLGSLPWLKFSYYSAAYPKESNVKGLHRTQMLLSAFQVANLSFNHTKGVTDKETGKVIAEDPESALSELGKRLGFKITQDDAEDYYKLHDLFKKKMKKEDYEKLLHIYFSILQSTRADIPDNLQADWKRLTKIHNYKTEFLPKDSKLLYSHE